MRFTTLAILLAAVSASPLDHDAVDKRATKKTTAKTTTTAAFCSTVKQLVTGASAHLAATKYCSSYLQIPLTTVTGTETRTPTKVVTVSPTLFTRTETADITSTETSTTTITNISTVTAAPTVTTKTETITSMTSVAPRCAIPNSGGTKMKRAAAPVPKPACFSTYTAADSLSSACSCLSISTSTVTATPRAANPTTITRTLPETYVTTNTPTTTVTETSSTDSVTTVTPTQTVTTQTVVTQTVNDGIIPTPTTFRLYDTGTGMEGRIQGSAGDFALSFAYSGTGNYFQLNNANDLVLVAGGADTGDGLFEGFTAGTGTSDPDVVHLDKPSAKNGRTDISCFVGINQSLGKCALVCNNNFGYVNSLSSRNTYSRWNLGSQVVAGSTENTMYVVSAD